MERAYRGRDYAFGQRILTLRTAIGLTQDSLAKHLGVSRRAVGEWEAGSSYPKAQHLKTLIALGMKCRVWTPGSEAKEIRALWDASRQKMLLDERWLSTLLDLAGSSYPRLVPKTAEVSTEKRPVEPLPTRGPRVDWSDALTVPLFYGRTQEKALLSKWVVQEHCRLVSVLGTGGIGKSALSVSLMYQLAEHFEVVIFRSLRDAPNCEALLDSCLQVLSPQPLSALPSTLEQCLSLLLSLLRKGRTLLVLDNLESLLEAGDTRGHFRPGFEGYGKLLHRVGEAAHQSCLLLTSREKLADLRPLEGKRSLVRSLRLAGLDTAACLQLFQEKELVGTKQDAERLTETYSGNPLALKIVAQIILDLFGGGINEFLGSDVVVFGSITDLLDEQFVRLSPLEQDLLCWLAISREPMTLDELQEMLVVPLPRVQILEAIDSLYRRSLIERGQRAGSFTLQAVVLEYVTAFLVTSGSNEIKLGQLDNLLRYGFSQATAHEYVRQTQERLLISPLLMQLQMVYLQRTEEVEEQLLSLLNQLREKDDSAQGYGPANLIALLQRERGHLSSLDLSNLCIRGAFLQGIQMQKTSLRWAVIRDTVWTSDVSATWGVAINQDGSLWAACGMRGEVRVWGENGRNLQLIWQAHTDQIMTLAFSPNGRWLSTGGLDNTVKLWDVANGTLLWMNWRNVPYNLAFSPDSSLLACSEMGPTVPIWDTSSGMNLQTLAHPAHVFALAWSPDGHLLASSCVDGQLRLWKRQEAAPSTSAEIFRLVSSWETNPVMSLAFAPDSRTLVSAGLQDRKVKLWDVGSGRLLHTFEGGTSQVSKVAFSPDGRILASSSYEHAIRLWNVEQCRIHSILYGHACDINDMVFTPDSRSLLSGSNDSTMRVWDVESGECVRVMQGYAVSYYSLDWSPDGMHLVSGGTDGVVTIWDVSGKTPPRAFHDRNWPILAVAWSPTGRLVASCGRIVSLWDPTSGSCVRSFDGPFTSLQSVAWSPDGSLLAVATFLHGMYVWDMIKGHPHWVGDSGRAVFQSAAWSPDGSLLAGGSDDGSVYLWESEDGTPRMRLSGHHGNVKSLAWSPNGQLLASGARELLMWDVLAEKCVLASVLRSGMVYTVAWSPSGDQVISGGSDGKLRWWDIQSRQCVDRQEGHQGTIRSLKVSPDGKFLASCGDDGTICIWDLASHKHVRILRRDRPYEQLNITGIRGLTEAQIASLQALGAIREREDRP